MYLESTRQHEQARERMHMSDITIKAHSTQRARTSSVQSSYAASGSSSRCSGPGQLTSWRKMRGETATPSAPATARASVSVRTPATATRAATPWRLQ